MKNITDIEALKTFLNEKFKDCDDFVLRPLGKQGCCGFVCFIKNICDRKYASARVVAPLLSGAEASFRGDFASLLQSAAFSDCDDPQKALEGVLSGNVLAALETDRLYCATVSADSFSVRGIEEPTSDVTVKGPRAGFTESGEANVAAMRRIIKSDRLKVLKLTVGSLTRTSVYIVYVEGRAEGAVVGRIKNALENAKATCIVDSGNIELLLNPKGTPLFPNMGSSEKTDKVASKLLAGRVGVFCDGSPFVLTAPYVFAESIQSAEDYLKNSLYATFMRVLRFSALLVSLLMPAIFTAAVYHDKWLLPGMVMKALQEMEKDVRLPFIGEMLLMLTAFEVIREVGVRMPRTVGDAVGLVAALLVGDATVTAGLAGTSALLIVAFSEVSGFIVPALSSASALLRYFFLLSAYAAGFYGLLFVFGGTALFLCFKKSFGAPYMSPVFPYNAMGMRDFLITVPKKVIGRKETLE